MPDKNPPEWTDHSPCPELPENLTGKVLDGRFRLDDRLAFTKISSVYRGHDLRVRVDVAVKVLHAELGPAWEERFRREGPILAQLRHPNIADFIDSWITEDGLCYLVTALIDGRSLADACHERGTLTLEQVWQVGLQIADALHCAHERGVIHRDVKPSNILRTAAGLVKLIDFGIAKLQPDAALELTPVRHPTMIGAVGTPGYIPPEADDQVDARTDVFGLGRTLYRLITRRPAADAPAGLQDTPEPLRKIVLQAMQADPASRIAGAAEFRQRWLEAGEQVWPRAPAGVDQHPTPQIWPPLADQIPSPQVDVLCAGPGATESCTASVPPRLFERRLELRRRLGSGHCGQTWRAYHHLLGRDVAVKIVPREQARPHIVAGLCREAVALDKLTHRAFPRVLECDYTADGSWYMVEEFIDGELFEDTFRRAPLDPLTAVDLVAEIAEALTEAHAHGILHGDIKSNNLILERSLPPRPRVIDLSECRLEEAFYAATDQRYALPPVHRPAAARIMGHPSFAAPELLRGEPKSAASDVYALGVVLFVLLTGRQGGAQAIREIFAGGEPDGARDRLRQVLISAAHELEDTFIAADFFDIVAPDPAARPTMADFLDTLRTEGRALRELRNPTPDRPASRPMAAATSPTVVRRLAVLGLAVALALVTLATAVVWISVRLSEPPAPTDHVVAPEPSASPTATPKPPELHARAMPTAPSVQLTREHVQAALAARVPDLLARCRDLPARLTLAIDVGPRVALAEVQFVELDPTLPLDSCLSTIVAGLNLPTLDTTTRYVVDLELEHVARQRPGSELDEVGSGRPRSR
jgi:serine/threonine protein kinase